MVRTPALWVVPTFTMQTCILRVHIEGLWATGYDISTEDSGENKAEPDQSFLCILVFWNFMIILVKLFGISLFSFIILGFGWLFILLVSTCSQALEPLLLLFPDNYISSYPPPTHILEVLLLRKLIAWIDYTILAFFLYIYISLSLWLWEEDFTKFLHRKFFKHLF